MTFDIEKARKVDVDLLALNNWAKLRFWYGAALDEIDRLLDENEQLRTPNACDDWGNPIVLSVGGGSCEDPQAKRIADLEESLTAAHMLGYHEAEKKSRDKIAGLEEALVEERAMVIFCHDPRSGRTAEGDKQEAREMLRQEGKL